MTRGDARGVVARVGLFSLASNLAVLFVIKFGAFVWPEGLPGGAHHVFWLASGVNVAGLLILGWRYWPVILLDAFPAWLIAGEALEGALLGSLANAMEALVAYGLIKRLGKFDGTFHKLRAVGALLLASMLAPICNTLIIPAYFIAKGVLAREDFWKALGTWNLANGAAMLLLAPLIVAMASHLGRTRRSGEGIALSCVAAVLGLAAFLPVFSGAGMNFAFLVFPVVLYAAVRRGHAGTSLVLGIILATIYGALAIDRGSQDAGAFAEEIWFTQAFCWVLAATGLLVAALVSERTCAEQLAVAERERSLEASLRAERTRLSALRYQINPHFLFNALNSVRAAMPLSEAVPREMVTKLSEYLRGTLDRPDTDTIELREELRSAENYLAIERMRFGDRLSASISADPGIENHEVPVFLLQPLVENAIRHGLEQRKGLCEIRISARSQDGRIKLEVANTGVWRAASAREGLGLSNIRRRLALLYRNDAELHIVHDDEWVRIRIDLPSAHALPHR